MRIVIIGYPGCGKSTVYRALTGSSAAGPDQSLASVPVPDERIDMLAQMYQPKKISYAVVEFVDLSAAVGMRKEAEELGQKFLTAVRTSQAIVHVIDAFSVPELADEAVVDAVEAVDTEFALSDFTQCEKRVERLQKEGIKPGPMKMEFDLLQEASDWLGKGNPLRLNKRLAGHDALRSFSFLSSKPIITVVNTAERAPVWEPTGLPDSVRERREGETGRFVPLCAQLESEIASLSPADAHAFLADYGIDFPAGIRVIRSGYELLGMMSFFTVGEDEVRAWTVRRKTNAQQAAAAIHSDICRGFIRAEVVDFGTTMKCGGFEEAKRNSKVRLEGKEYSVQDGEIVHFRYNV